MLFIGLFVLRDDEDGNGTALLPKAEGLVAVPDKLGGSDVIVDTCARINDEPPPPPPPPAEDDDDDEASLVVSSCIEVGTPELCVVVVTVAADGNGGFVVAAAAVAAAACDDVGTLFIEPLILLSPSPPFF